jgi:cytochrome c peroxidase
MKGLRIVALLILLLGVLAAKESYMRFPNYFPKPIYDFNNNPLSKEKIELGRVLFYDPLLSKDGSVSCASCHSSYNAFAHTDHALSHGINDQIGSRNAPALMNLAWHKSFMWDGSINHLDVQALAPISHPKEMGEQLNEVVIKLQRTKLYADLFQNAYGDQAITGEKILKAISQFQLTLVSANSKYDRMRQKKEVYNEQEEKGYMLYKKNCSSCHVEPLFSSFGFANNGLSIDTTLNDFGKGAINKLAQDSLKFKIPSLRNLSYTYPYMHDGRFTKLMQVLNHYTGKIVSSPTLAPELRSPIQLTSNDKADLIAFLLTLDDKEFVFNPKFQFPKEILLPSEGR